jgi:2-methylcitrate dehydratase PrpD
MAALAATLARNVPEGFSLSVKDYEENLRNPAMQALERRVRCEVDPEVEQATLAESVAARIILRLQSGATLSTFVPAPKGSPSRPFARTDHMSAGRRIAVTISFQNPETLPRGNQFRALSICYRNAAHLSAGPFAHCLCSLMSLHG